MEEAGGKGEMRKEFEMRWKILAALTGITLALAGCQSTSGSPELPTPENLYAQDSSIDLFVYEDTAYVNYADADWVQEKTFEKGEPVGEIKDSGVTEDFQDWDSTVLPEGTVIYESDDDTILLAECDGELIPYLKWVEG